MLCGPLIKGRESFSEKIEDNPLYQPIAKLLARSNPNQMRNASNVYWELKENIDAFHSLVSLETPMRKDYAAVMYLFRGTCDTDAQFRGCNQRITNLGNRRSNNRRDKRSNSASNESFPLRSRRRSSEGRKERRKRIPRTRSVHSRRR